MNDRVQTAPTLGPIQLILVVLLTVAIGWFVAGSIVSEAGQPASFAQHRWMKVGCLYGVVAAGCWMATAIEHRYRRLVARALIVIVATFLLGALRQQREFVQTAADFTGLAIILSALFHWFRVPAWTVMTAADATFDRQKRDQFAIADLVISTTVVAILLALMIRYSSAIRPFRYWSVLAATWTGGASVALLVTRGMLAATALKTIGYLIAACLLAYAGTYAVAVADCLAHPRIVVDDGRLSLGAIQWFAQLYGRIVVAYVATFTAYAAVARI